MNSYRELVVSSIALVTGILGLAAKLTELNDSQQLRYVIIIAYIIFAGGIIWFAFRNEHASQKQQRLSLAFLCVVTAPFFFLWVVNWTKEEAFNPCAEYGITITKPANGYLLVNEEVTIQGRFSKRPPDRSIQLIGFAGGQYWPHNLGNVEITATSWKGQSYGQGNYTALVAYVGENGRILFDYFQIAGERDSVYPGLNKLPADVVECDSVFIPFP